MTTGIISSSSSSSSAISSTESSVLETSSVKTVAPPKNVLQVFTPIKAGILSHFPTVLISSILSYLSFFERVQAGSVNKDWDRLAPKVGQHLISIRKELRQFYPGEAVRRDRGLAMINPRKFLRDFHYLVLHETFAEEFLKEASLLAPGRLPLSSLNDFAAVLKHPCLTPNMAQLIRTLFLPDTGKRHDSGPKQFDIRAPNGLFGFVFSAFGPKNHPDALNPDYLDCVCRILNRAVRQFDACVATVGVETTRTLIDKVVHSENDVVERTLLDKQFADRQTELEPICANLFLLSQFGLDQRPMPRSSIFHVQCSLLKLEQAFGRFLQDGSLELPKAKLESSNLSEIGKLLFFYPHETEKILDASIGVAKEDAEKGAILIRGLVRLCIRIEDKEYLLKRFDAIVEADPDKFKDHSRLW